MAIKKVAEYEHGNADLAFVDSSFVRGGGRSVADLSALYALSTKSDQLKQNVSMVYVEDEDSVFLLTDDSNIGNANGWTDLSDVTGGGGPWVVSNNDIYNSNSGNVGIGTSTPNHLLDVESDGASARIYNTAGSTQLYLQAYTGSNSTINFADLLSANAGAITYRHASDSLAFNVNAVERIRIDSSGNVGIGTTSPAARLEVAGSATTNVDVAYFSNSNSIEKGIIRLNSLGAGEFVLRDPVNNDDVVLSAQGNSYFTGGNVGIGTTSPSAELHVETSSTTSDILAKSTGSNAQITADGFANSGFVMKENGTLKSEVFYDSLNNQMKIRTSSAESLSIGVNNGQDIFINGSSGNVGIGTTSPSSKLQVQGSIRAADTNFVQIEVDQTDSAQINMGVTSGTTQGFIRVANTGTGHLSDDPSLKILFNSNTTATFTSDGRLGIGTSSPASPLHIYSNNSTTGTNAGLTIEQDGDGDPVLQFFATGARRFVMGIDNSDADRFKIANSVDLTSGAALSIDGDSVVNFHEGITTNSDANVGYGNITTTQNGTVVRGGFMNPAAEGNMVHLPHIVNDLAGFQKWGTITTSGLYKTRSGTSGSYTYSNEVTVSDFDNGAAFDGYSSHAGSWYSDNGVDGTTVTPGTIELSWDYELTYSAWVGIVFGANSFTATYVKIEAYRGGEWQRLCEITNNTDQVVLRQIGSNAGTGSATTRIRYTLGGSVNNSYFRIHTLYVANYKAGDNRLSSSYPSIDHVRGVHYLEKYKNNYVHGGLYPADTTTYDIGSSTYKWNNLYVNNVRSSSIINTGGITIDGPYALTVDHGSQSGNTGISLDGTGSNLPFLRWYDGSTQIAGMRAMSSGNFVIQTNGFNDRLAIDSSGNVGINTTSPQKKLEVITAASDFASVGVATLGVSAYTGIHFGYRENNNLYRKSAIVFQRTDLTSNNAQGKVHILNGPQSGSGNATLSDAKLTIAENGNVGIGTTSPTHKLHVVGQIKVDNGSSPYVLPGSDGNVGQVLTTDGNGVVTWGAGGGGGGGGLWSANGNDIYYNLGNVGIGTTSPVHTLDLKTNPAIGFYHSDGTYQGLIGDGSATVSGGGIYDIGFRANSGYNLLFAAGGSTERMRIDSSGNVGIGTTTPNTELEVVGDITVQNKNGSNPTDAGSLYFAESGDIWGTDMYGFRINQQGVGNYLNFQSANTTTVRNILTLDRDSGNVGIGTTAPSEKLDVVGNISASGNLYLDGIIETDEVRSRTYPDFNILNLEDDNVTNSNGVSLLSVSSMTFGLDSNDNAAGDRFEWRANGAAANAGTLLMALTDQGRLGIGTSSPSTNLDIVSSGVNGLNLSADTNNSSLSGRLFLSTATTGQSVALLNSGGNFTFRTQATPNNSSGTERVRIDSSGNVGIGTTSPSKKLHVEGGDLLVQNSSNTFLDVKGVGANAYLRAYSDSNSVWLYQGGTNSYLSSQAGSTLNINSGTSNLIFSDSSGEVFRTNSGNVGIGTTSPATKLEVNDATSPILTLRNPSANPANAGMIKFIESTNTDGFQLTFNGSDNKLKFISDISGTEAVRMVIQRADGNVGIGTESPSEKLDVVGQMNLDDGSNNVMISSGNSSLTTGIQNTAVGLRAGINLTTGLKNTAIGADALYAATTATTDSNTAVGHSALYEVTGNANVGIGRNAGLKSGTANVAVGSYCVNNTTGSYNVGVGYNALTGGVGSTFSNTVGIGYQALFDLTTGADNTAVGFRASANVTTSDYNVSLGNYALYTNQVGDANTALGYAALYQTTSGNNTAVGFSAGYFSGSSNAALGYRALQNTTGNNNVAIGLQAAQGVIGTSTFSNTVAVGYQALTELTTGVHNIAVGYQAGFNLKTGAYNVSLGNSALRQNEIGEANTAVGYAALYQTTGSYNTAVGHFAAYSAGAYNAAFGSRALEYTTGGYNVAVGQGAARGVSGESTFSNTVAVGYQAGAGLTIGGSNVLIGYQAGSTLITESNKLYIENSNSATPLIYGEFDNNLVRINGELQVGDPASTGFKLPTADGTANQVLSTDGSGTVTWATVSGSGVDTTLASSNLTQSELHRIYTLNGNGSSTLAIKSGENKNVFSFADAGGVGNHIPQSTAFGSLWVKESDTSQNDAQIQLYDSSGLTATIKGNMGTASGSDISGDTSGYKFLVKDTSDPDKLVKELSFDDLVSSIVLAGIDDYIATYGGVEGQFQNNGVTGDFNGDGLVGSADLLAFLTQYGNSSSTIYNVPNVEIKYAPTVTANENGATLPFDSDDVTVTAGTIAMSFDYVNDIITWEDNASAELSVYPNKTIQIQLNQATSSTQGMFEYTPGVIGQNISFYMNILLYSSNGTLLYDDEHLINTYVAISAGNTYYSGINAPWEKKISDLYNELATGSTVTKIQVYLRSYTSTGEALVGINKINIRLLQN